MLVITANTLRQQLTNTEGEHCGPGGGGRYIISITAVVAIYGTKVKL